MMDVEMASNSHSSKTDMDDQPENTIHLVDPVKDFIADKPSQAQVTIARQYSPELAPHSIDSYGSTAAAGVKGLLAKLQFRHGPALPRSHATVDLLATIFCFAAVHFAYLGSLDLTSGRTITLLGALLFLVFSLVAGGTYDDKGLRRLQSELTTLALCWVCAFAALGLFAFLTKTAGDVSRVWITTSMFLTLGLLASVRIISSLGFMSEHKTSGRKVVVCGNLLNIESVTSDVRSLACSRVRIAQIFEFSSPHPSEGSPARLSRNATDDIVSYIEEQRQAGTAVEQVWIAVSSAQTPLVQQLSARLLNSSVDVCIIPDAYTERLLNSCVIRFGEGKIVNISEISLPPASDRFKRVFDFFLASAGLALLAMPMLVIAALVKLDSPGPALFRQKRYGVDGKEIDVLKFRSMRVHDDSNVQQATKGDARVTKIGRILRSSSLDELPQLLNVVRGTMSLVGPRPHAVAHNELWRREIDGYMLRHKVRPGITGWAQVNGWRGETDKVYKMQQRVKFDLEYIRNWSPLLDVKIIFMTIFKGFRGENAY